VKIFEIRGEIEFSVFYAKTNVRKKIVNDELLFYNILNFVKK